MTSRVFRGLSGRNTLHQIVGAKAEIIEQLQDIYMYLTVPCERD
jgi:hypothetical protein